MRTSHYITSLILLILLTTFISSCTERIDIELDESYTRLVVEGGITDQPGPHEVVLSFSGNYYENAPPRMVEGAVVSISDGMQTFPLTEVLPGIYHTAADVHGIPGKTYTLTIEGVEINGEERSFTASSFMPPVGEVDSIKVGYRDDWEIWQVQLYAQDPTTREFYLFKIYKNNELMTDTIDEYVITSDDFFNGNYTYGITVQWLPKAQAMPGDTIILEMASITEDYATFIWEVQTESGFSNPLFSGPPANISTNISNGAIGFFQASSQVRAQTVIRQPE